MIWDLLRFPVAWGDAEDGPAPAAHQQAAPAVHVEGAGLHKPWMARRQVTYEAEAVVPYLYHVQAVAALVADYQHVPAPQPPEADVGRLEGGSGLTLACSGRG